MPDRDLIGKMVIDNSGNIVGKCVDLKDKGEEENTLVVKIRTKKAGIIKSDIPMSTIQAIGKTIVLAVEIEGLIDDQDVLPFKEDLEERDENGDSPPADKVPENSWVLYKSIKTDK